MDNHRVYTFIYIHAYISCLETLHDQLNTLCIQFIAIALNQLIKLFLFYFMFYNY